MCVPSQTLLRTPEEELATTNVELLWDSTSIFYNEETKYFPFLGCMDCNACMHIGLCCFFPSSPELLTLHTCKYREIVSLFPKDKASIESLIILWENWKDLRILQKELLRRLTDFNDLCTGNPFWFWFLASHFSCWRYFVITLKNNNSNKKKNKFLNGRLELFFEMVGKSTRGAQNAKSWRTFSLETCRRRRWIRTAGDVRLTRLIFCPS